MPRLLLTAVCAALLLGLATGVSAQSDTPKTLVIGFDGMDHGLTQQFMDEGLLPNLSKLASSGHFGRLETSNPAQSPVSWAVFNTGSNPGKTGVGGFVSRYFNRDANGNAVGIPLPQPMLGFADSLPADDLVGFPMALHNPQGFAAGAGAIALLVVFVLLKLFKAKAVIALVLALGAGAGGWYMASQYVAELPPQGTVPYEVNPMQGENFWRHLDKLGVRTMGIQIASTFPPDEEGPNTRLLSGLGVKDISGSPGSWFVFTDDPWAWEDDTNAGGKIKKVYFDLDDPVHGEQSRATAELPGPTDWVAEQQHLKVIEALEAAQTDPSNTEAQATQYEEQLRDANSDYNKWKKSKAATVSFDLIADRKESKTVTVRVQGTEVEVREGGWSDFLPVTFQFSERFAAHGVVRFHVIKCDEDEVRVFVPPINIDPARPPEWLPISAPPEFAAEIREGIGRSYETLGWACMTNPLKDTEDTSFTPQGFLDDIAATMEGREAILDWALDRGDEWDVYYQVFSTTDRIGHMLFREFDPQHPAHDAEYADQQMNAWGRSFRLGDSLREVYKEADRIVGGLLERMDSGELGEDPMLLIVADHGFSSFRRGVNLNNLLHEFGYLKTKGDKALSEFSGQSADLLLYADWSRTRAYSMGLGKLFINLAGREPEGIVTEAEYDELIASIQRDLMSVTDGAGGPQVFTSVTRRDVLFDGPWYEEGSGQRRKAGELQPAEDHDGFADLFVGYEPYYRVSWNNTMGGVDKAAITDNTNHWSGGHVSVDPIHVPGVFFSNRKLSDGGAAGLIDVGPTLMSRYGVDLGQTDVDGRALPFEDLSR
jgi:predicted AlkP superfamily phosphohydrolase/phosphomutase